MKRAVVLLFFAALCACAPATRADTAAPSAAALMDWPDLLSRPRPSPTHTVQFAEGAAGSADLWLPQGDGPFPVVLMVHGGCWQTAIADHTIMNYAANALRDDGFAVWNIEYRGVDDDGGGYPGTYQDVARAADALRDVAAQYHLDLTRVVGFGHSAGGHLVAWLAARARVPRQSILYVTNPLGLKGVVTTGGLEDLRNADEGCSPRSVSRMTGAPSASRPNIYADTSPAEMLPLGVPTIVVNGDSDPIAPVAMGADYVRKARSAGERAEQIVAAQTGHVEEITPDTEAFRLETSALHRLAR